MKGGRAHKSALAEGMQRVPNLALHSRDFCPGAAVPGAPGSEEPRQGSLVCKQGIWQQLNPFQQSFHDILLPIRELHFLYQNSAASHFIQFLSSLCPLSLSLSLIIFICCCLSAFMGRLLFQKIKMNLILCFKST